MIHLKCTYENGDSSTTEFNDTWEDAENYYLGHSFNLGPVEDNMQRCVRIELLDKEKESNYGSK